MGTSVYLPFRPWVFVGLIINFYLGTFISFFFLIFWDFGYFGKTGDRWEEVWAPFFVVHVFFEMLL